MTAGENPWNGQERRGSDRVRDVANEEIDNFSIETLGYNRNRPRAGQRTPAEILEEVDERITANKARTATLRKVIGAMMLTIFSVVVAAVTTTLWPSISAWVWGHL